MRRLIDRFPALSNIDRRYALPGAIGGGVVLALGVFTLWVAGAFDGGNGEESLVECPPCPSGTPTQTPFTASARAVTPRPCCTPTIAPTAAPTEAPATAPPATQAPAPPPPAPATYALHPFLSDGSFNRIVDFAIIPGTNGIEAIVVSQTDERILRVSLTGAFAPTVYGDLSDYVSSGGEEGLLSATFSPDFLNDRRIYVYYTQGAPAPTILSRFNVPGQTIDTGNETRILEVPDFASNHNGGRVLFGPDGYLYLSLGDGGGGGDPQENGQNIDSLLGKVIRLNVTGQDRYSVPSDNPFVGASGLDEIWAYGLRNPWRYSFDRATGQLWLGDVGQGSFEEVNLIVRGGNYGWDCYEGFAEFEGGCSADAVQFPRAVYSLAGAECAVTGGYVYRGSALPELAGHFIFADYCSGVIWALNTADPAAEPFVLIDSEHSISSFAELPDGELLVLTFSNAIFRLGR